ncbi:MAG: hypothetical protein WC623_11745 [Pedobacter sp.]|uniref:hypothetical protein n=1 Tax=Pedobacter sp. TaxID=1411316 RepID=UPI003562392C
MTWKSLTREFQKKEGVLLIIKVAPWGHHYDKEEISVASSQYEEIQIGQMVKID